MGQVLISEDVYSGGFSAEVREPGEWVEDMWVPSGCLTEMG
jgi:hypothetical protein